MGLSKKEYNNNNPILPNELEKLSEEIDDLIDTLIAAKRRGRDGDRYGVAIRLAGAATHLIGMVGWEIGVVVQDKSIAAIKAKREMAEKEEKDNG